MFLFSVNLFADNDLFKIFQLSYVGLDFIDICSSLYGVESLGGWEKKIIAISAVEYRNKLIFYGVEIGSISFSPIARIYPRGSLFAVSVRVVLDFMIIKFTDLLFKKNKKLAWAVIISLNLIKGYIVYRSFKILEN